MAKLTLTDIANISGAEATAISNINSNSDSIESALENTLSRDGTTPNTMSVDLDLNSNDILNAGTVNATEVTVAGVGLATSVAAAATSASNAATSEANAATSATNASTSASNSSTSASASAVSAQSAADSNFEWQGAYSGATAYVPGDVVSSSGNTYINTLASTGNTPPNSTYWDLMAAEGAAGAGSGDMLVATYDPTAAAADAFDMGNMAEGTTNKILTATERTNIAAVDTAAKVKTVYEGNSNTNAFTDANQTSLTNVGVQSIIVAISDETTSLTTGTAKLTFRMPYGFELTDLRGSLTTASSSGLPTFDVNLNGATILSTKLTIDASETTSTSALVARVISTSTLTDNGNITIDIDVAGTGATGAKITFIGYKT